MVIEVNNLTKKIKGVDILKNINLKINEGEIFGLIGPNGAGKTTFVRLLLNLYSPSSGSIFIDGINVNSKEFEKLKNKIGFLFDNIGLFKDLTAWDNLEFFDRIYYPKSNKNERIKRIKELLHEFDLIDKKDNKITFFSRGMKQRLALARSLINNPKLLILDEPSRGLDLEGQIILRHFIELIKNKGCTILINSHDLGELQKICTNVAFINNGKIILSGKYDDIQKKYSKNTYLIKANGILKKLEQLKKLDKIDLIINNENEVIITTSEKFNLSEWIFINKIKVDEFKQINKDLEDLYKDIILRECNINDK